MYYRYHRDDFGIRVLGWYMLFGIIGAALLWPVMLVTHYLGGVIGTLLGISAECFWISFCLLIRVLVKRSL